MKMHTQFRRMLFVGLGLTTLAILLFVRTAIDPPRAEAQRPRATPKRPANNYQYILTYIAKNACQEFCVGWAVGGSVDGYGVILRTDDSGVTWRRQGHVGAIPDVSTQGVSAIDSQNAWVVGGNKILRTYDGGENWKSQKLPDGLPSNFELFQVKALNSQTAFVAGGSGILLQTINGGTDWYTMPVRADLPLIQYSDLDAVDATHVWAVGGVISGTDDVRAGLAIAFYDGVQWQPQLITHRSATGACSSLISVSAVDQDVAWAVGGPKCPPYKTNNGGTTWQAVGPALDEQDTNRIVAVTRDLIWTSTDNDFYRTLNGGNSWDPTPSNCGGAYNFCYTFSAVGKYAWGSDTGGGLYRWVDNGPWGAPTTPVNTMIMVISFVGARR